MMQRAHERMIERLRQQGIRNPDVLDAMSQVPRHLFVDTALIDHAYADYPMPIGYGQTISQPYIVARMTETLLSQGTINEVLEIGTGCGYQTAILAHLIDKVYTVERISNLLTKAQKRIEALELTNIDYYHSDGQWGLREHAPYHGIIVTAAPEVIPQSLLEQLAVDGRLIIPVGPRGLGQKLLKITRHRNRYEQKFLDDVSFVPLKTGIE